MNLKKAAIVVALVSSAGALWASMAAPVMPIPGMAVRLIHPLLAPVRAVRAPSDVTRLDDRIRLQALVLSQA